MARDDPDGALFLFRQNLNAATDAAIPRLHQCQQSRASEAMFLVLLCIFVVAGAGLVEAPTLDFVA
jgi:hypothetical protein